MPALANTFRTSPTAVVAALIADAVLREFPKAKHRQRALLALQAASRSLEAKANVYRITDGPMAATAAAARAEAMLAIDSVLDLFFRGDGPSAR